MASVINELANEGTSVKIEHDNLEINTMALEMKKRYQQNATKKQAASQANVHINKTGKAVTLENYMLKINQEKLAKDCEDIESIKGKFSWKCIEEYQIPYIIRVINGENFKFVSVRMAATQLLSKHLHYLTSDIYSCTSVRRRLITDSEAKLLNEINQTHSDCIYGKEMFNAGNDYISFLEDIIECYIFIDVCYKMLLGNTTPGGKKKCGFILIDSGYTVPYCVIDGEMYVPLFYFEGKIENLRHQAIKIENWNLAYLKFCFKVQGIRDDLFASNSCTVTNLVNIKKLYRPDTNFEDYWPNNKYNSQFLSNQVNSSTHVNSPGACTRAPPEVEPTEHTIPLTLIAPVTVITQSTPMIRNTYQKGLSANQLVNSNCSQAQPSSTTCSYSIAARNQSIGAQCYNAGSTMSQVSSLINSAGHVVPPLSVIRVGNTTPVIGNTFNIKPISQCINTKNKSMNNSNLMSHSSQLRQFFTQYANNSQAQQPQLQLQQIQHHQQQQQIITTQQSYSGQSVHGNLTNTQKRNTLKNFGPSVIAPATEIIDLTSPPSSPVPQTVQENSLCPNVECELTERVWTYDSSNHAYKVNDV